MERAASLCRPMIVHTFCHLHFPPFGGTLCLLRSQSQRGRSLAPSSPFLLSFLPFLFVYSDASLAASPRASYIMIEEMMLSSSAAIMMVHIDANE